MRMADVLQHDIAADETIQDLPCHGRQSADVLSALANRQRLSLQEVAKKVCDDAKKNRGRHYSR